MRTVVFDLDGTLADTSGDLIAAANFCFRDMGAGDLLDARHDAGTALRGGRAMLKLGLERMGRMPDQGPDRGSDEDVIKAYYPVLLEAYGAAIDTHTVLYPGAMEAVEALKLAGFGVSICTNKPEALARQLLRSLAVHDAFGGLIGADTLPVSKPDPAPLREAVRIIGGDPARCVMVGDTVTDRDTARAARVPCVLVTFGPHGQGVHEMAPDGTINHYEQLQGVVERLLA